MPKVALPKGKRARFHVSGDVLKHRDFVILVHPNWLNDKIINAYLHLLMTKLENTVQLVKEQLKKSQSAYRAQYNKKAKSRSR